MKIAALLLTFLPVISAQAGNPTQPESAPPAIKRVAAAKALISGVEQDGSYGEIPPVLVELDKLPPRAAVWVEVQRGETDSTHPAVAVKSKMFLRSEQRNILNVLGLHRACRSGGTWTMKVFTGSGLAKTTLATTTFHVRPGLSVPGALVLNP